MFKPNLFSLLLSKTQVSLHTNTTFLYMLMYVCMIVYKYITVQCTCICRHFCAYYFLILYDVFKKNSKKSQFLCTCTYAYTCMSFDIIIFKKNTRILQNNHINYLKVVSNTRKASLG